MNNLTTSAMIRLALYVIAVLTGLASIVLGAIGMVEYTGLLAAISGGLLTLTGGTAALNIQKGKNDPVNIGELVQAGRMIVDEAVALRDIRQPEGTATFDPGHTSAPPAEDVQPERKPVLSSGLDLNAIQRRAIDLYDQVTKKQG